MHYYGDKDFNYWEELDQAASYIGLFCRKYGRIGVSQYKEKYGTVRVYCSFGWDQFGEIIYPGYQWCKGRKWLWRVYIPFWVSRLFAPYQQFIYRLAYKNAIKKWPMIRKEILCCADWSEYLGGL